MNLLFVSRYPFWLVLLFLGLLCNLNESDGALAQDRFALVIGVNRYSGDFRPLEYAGRDARDVGIALQRLGYNVVTMDNDQNRGDLNPTSAEKMLAKIAALAQSAKEGDTLVLFMSGHGCQFEGDSETYFCPSDGSLANKDSLIPISLVMSLLEKSKSKHRLILLDACQEEILSNDRTKGAIRRIKIPDLVDTERDVPKSLAVFFSCSPKQLSFEDPNLPNLLDADGERGQGIFSHFIIKYLSGQASAQNYGSNGEIEISLMENFVRTSTLKHAESIGKTQIPYMRFEGGFPLASCPKKISDIHETPLAGLNLKRINAGSFNMGSPASEINAVKAWDPSVPSELLVTAQPQHRVTLSQDYYIGLHEVTRGQFRAFVTQTGYVTDCEKDGLGGRGYTSGGSNKLNVNFDWRNCGFPQTDDHPVVNTSWNDAVAFCRWLTMEGRRNGQLTSEENYRLPTEAEWEYSARAGSRGWYSFGDKPEELVRYGNVADAMFSTKQYNQYRIAQSEDGYVFTSPVGRFRPNSFGLFDMHGNVWEWCSDWYGEYSSRPVTDPVGPQKGSLRVYRGGCRDSALVFSRSATRGSDIPTGRDYCYGFRVALTLSAFP